MKESAIAGTLAGMPRTSRVAPGGMVFHVLNRGVGRRQLFGKDRDFEAFLDVVQEVLKKSPMRICGYCLMPNHWHFVLWPEKDGDLAAFMQRLTVTHVTRWQKHRKVVGEGHVYQGRYKSFPVQTDEYYYRLLRYVERDRAESTPTSKISSSPSFPRPCQPGSPAQELRSLRRAPEPASDHSGGKPDSPLPPPHIQPPG